MTNKFAPTPTHIWICEDCNESGVMYKKNQPAERSINEYILDEYILKEDQLTECPKCGSNKIDIWPNLSRSPVPKPDELDKI